MNTETSLYRIYFTLGTDHFGRRLQTSTVQRAINVEEAIEQVVAQGVGREAITGHEPYGGA